MEKENILEKSEWYDGEETEISIFDLPTKIKENIIFLVKRNAMQKIENKIKNIEEAIKKQTEFGWDASKIYLSKKFYITIKKDCIDYELYIYLIHGGTMKAVLLEKGSIPIDEINKEIIFVISQKIITKKLKKTIRDLHELEEKIENIIKDIKYDC